MEEFPFGAEAGRWVVCYVWNLGTRLSNFGVYSMQPILFQKQNGSSASEGSSNECWGTLKINELTQPHLFPRGPGPLMFMLRMHDQCHCIQWCSLPFPIRTLGKSVCERDNCILYENGTDKRHSASNLSTVSLSQKLHNYIIGILKAKLTCCLRAVITTDRLTALCMLQDTGDLISVGRICCLNGAKGRLTDNNL